MKSSAGTERVRREPATLTHVPLHVSAFWKPLWTKSPISTGSLGAGVLLCPGAVCKRGRKWPPLPTSLSEVECRLPVPVGKGFATSAAVALGSALLEYPFWEGVAKAHVAEVLNRTGLGDVMAIAFGSGVAVRVRPGGPGWGRVESLDVPKEIFVVAFSVESPFKDTPSMLRRLKVEEAFDRAWDLFSGRRDFWSFLEAAELFSEEVGFASAVEKEFLKGSLGWYVKKSAAVAFVEGGCVEEVFKKVKKRYKDAKVFRACNKTPLAYTIPAP